MNKEAVVLKFSKAIAFCETCIFAAWSLNTFIKTDCAEEVCINKLQN